MSECRLCCLRPVFPVCRGDGNGQASAMVEGTLLEASRSHVSVVFRADAADQFEDMGAGKS